MRNIESYAIAFVLLILTLAFVRPQKSLSFYEPKGYVVKANRLIADRKVVFEPSTGKMEAKGMDRDEQYWYINSYLSKDVDAFNSLCAGALALHPNRLPAPCEPFADRFLFDGATLIRVNGTSHVAAVPGASTLPWKGELRYFPQAGAGTLQGELHTVSLLPLLREVPAKEFTSIPIGGPERWFHATVGSFRFGSAAHSANGAEVWSIGTTAVLKDRQASGQRTGILIRGNELPPGRIVMLKDGDWIHFQDQRNPQRAPGHTYLYSERDLAGLISWVVDRNNRDERVTRRSTLGFADEFVSAMNGLYREVGPASGGADRDMSIDLTVHSNLQDSMTLALRDFMDRHFAPGSRDLLGDSSRPRRAGAVVMDLFSGDVLALPTYPTEHDLDRFGGLSPLQRKRLLSNQNLPLHPVGSAAKPFWTGAILNRYPFMSGFTLPAHAAADQETAAGIKLAGTYEDHNHGPTDVESFLEVSCNKYMVDFATVALALNPDRAESRHIGRLEDAMTFGKTDLAPLDKFSICGQTASRAPELSYLGENGLENLDQNRIFTELEKIHHIDTYAYRAPDELTPHSGNAPLGLSSAYRSDRYLFSVWGDLAGKFPARSAEDKLAVRLRLGVLSPERVNFGVNRLGDFRSEWVSLLLGGSTGLWNNVQLAEALSRVVSGRTVEARFAHEIAGQRETRELHPIAGYDGAGRRLVLSGMNKVVTGSKGTATQHLAELRTTLGAHFGPLGYDVLLYGKTGSPTVEVFAPTRMGAVARELYDRKGIGFDGQRVSITPQGTRLLEQRHRLSTFADIVSDMNEDLAAYTVGQSHTRRSALFKIENNVLQLNPVSNAVQHSIPTKGTVFILAVVLAPKGRVHSAVDVPACISSAVANNVRAVPSAQELEPGKAVGITVAAYVEDTDKVAGEVTVLLINDIRAELQAALDERLAATLRAR